MDQYLIVKGILAAISGAVLGTLVQVGKQELAAPGAAAPELQAAPLQARAAVPSAWASPAVAAPDLLDVAHGLNRLSRASGARMLARDCGAPPCIFHFSWTDDRDLRAAAALEAALVDQGWVVRSQATVVEAPGDGRWFSHLGVAVWPRAAAPAAADEAAALDRVRGLLRAAAR